MLYLHGGWSSLVEGLADVVRAGGGQIRTRATVDAVEHDTRVRSVRLTDGTTIAADAAVLAVNNAHRVPSLLDGPGASAVERATSGAVPVRMAHLDVALRPLPERRLANVLGIDVPIYLTVQSDVADVAPPGGATLHVGRYLRPGEEEGDHRGAIEHFLDVVQPGWQDHVIDARYAPRSMVCGDHVRAPRQRGTLDRPAVAVAGVAGLAIAGDWVGPAGTLADAAILSGRAAASAIMDADDDPDSHPRMTALDDGGAAFEAARPKLMAIAYRLLGSVAEAEDVIGDVAERWAVADRDAVRVPEAWLVTATTAARPRRPALGPLAARELPRCLAAGAGRHG